MSELTRRTRGRAAATRCPSCSGIEVSARDGRARPPCARRPCGIWQATTLDANTASAPRRSAWACAGSGCSPATSSSILAETKPEWLLRRPGHAVRRRRLHRHLLRPIRPSRSTISSTTAARASCSWRTRSSSTRSWQCASAARRSRRIFVFDMEGLRDFHDPHGDVASTSSWRSAARTTPRTRPRGRSAMAARTADDLALLVYTSGTTGPPKGAMLSPPQHHLPDAARRRASSRSAHDDEQLAFLPLCHVAERIFGALHAARAPASSPISPRAPTRCRRTCARWRRPSFFAVPRIWERLYSGIAIRMKEATCARPPGLRLGARHRLQGRRAPSSRAAALRRPGARRCGVADLLVLDNIKRAIGMHRIRLPAPARRRSRPT